MTTQTTQSKVVIQHCHWDLGLRQVCAEHCTTTKTGPPLATSGGGLSVQVCGAGRTPRRGVRSRRPDFRALKVDARWQR
jgi:hypothetical protein